MCHALVIEDEPVIAMMIEDCLRMYGADSIDVAATEAEAITAAKRRRPDFITSDVKLLEGSGPSAVAAIIGIYGKIPVVFITGNPDACDGWPAEAILSKPANAAKVGARLRMHCG